MENVKMLCKTGMGRCVYHFHDHSDPNEPLFASNPEEVPLDLESRELYSQRTLPNYRTALLHFIGTAITIQKALKLLG